MKNTSLCCQKVSFVSDGKVILFNTACSSLGTELCVYLFFISEKGVHTTVKQFLN